MAQTVTPETSPSTPVDEAPQPRVRRGPWAAFTGWRRRRPFWGALVLSLGGWFVMKPVVGATGMLMHMGVGGVAAYVLGIGMIAAALTGLFKPAQRHFPAIMAAVMSVASLPLANLGGWLVGMLLGVVGSGMLFAWTPFTEAQLAKYAARDARRALRRAAAAAPQQPTS